MKKLLIMLLVLFISISVEAKERKEHLPFAPKGKHGKLRTKQCKPVRQKESWIYRQWGRN